MAIEYSKTKPGALVAKKFTTEQLQQADHDQNGFCRACGAEAYGVEPGARRYHCESCGLHQVYGASELAIMGQVRDPDGTEA
jgi:hypothetical protein